MPRWRIVVSAAALVLAWPALVSAQKPPDKPPPVHGGSSQPGSGPGPKPKQGLKPNAAGSKPKASWVKQADTACRTGERGRAAVLDSVERKPPSSVRKALLDVLAGEVKVEGKMLSQLGAIHVSSGARRATTQALDLFRERRSQDSALVAKLRRHWNANLLDRQVRSDRAANDRLRKLWAGLGVHDCSAYFRELEGS